MDQVKQRLSKVVYYICLFNLKEDTQKMVETCLQQIKTHYQSLWLSNFYPK